MSNPNRTIDKTHLSIDQAELRGFIHRDYIAHCFRWSHVVKFLMQRHRFKEEIIMDIGCGRDLPLPRLMYANKMTDFAYVGMDMNPLTMPEMLKTAVVNGKADIQLMGQTDASKVQAKDIVFEAPTVSVCFEVLEHVHPTICQRLVRNIYALLADNSHAFFSTPVWNGSAAANHIHEMKYDTVGALLEFCGFEILAHFGTFASQSEIEPKIHEYNLTSWYEKLSNYYDSNVLSTIFAPLFPEQSRNVIWHCRKSKTVPYEGVFGPIEGLPRPLSQHPEAEKLFQ
jgi:2-polyprenyl-3-methyl-5-hydroxy-6-metoxy-1,4-benzoquinol methylase